jgi:prepilin-type N-terminal cleavage/methylation domain-containing protein
MECALNKSSDGFTLVEISIVMIIIGLLIGGTFGGMKLIENMQINRTVQDLKAIDSAAITFRDTYGRLPGDIRNPSTRLANCTVAPCATGGNGDRRISPLNSATSWSAPPDPTYERFTFWSHLQAANLLSLGTKNTTDLTFDEGQPSSPIGGGYRISEYTGAGWICSTQSNNGLLLITGTPDLDIGDPSSYAVPCRSIQSVDRKTDDGQQWTGKVLGVGCSFTFTCSAASSYDASDSSGYLWYDTAF